MLHSTSFGRQVGLVVDIPPEVNEIMHLGIHLAGCLDAESGGGTRHSPRAQNALSQSWASETVRPSATHTITTKSAIFLRFSDDYETTPTSSVYTVMPHGDIAGSGSQAVSPMLMYKNH